jgi:hypothetical protein
MHVSSLQSLRQCATCKRDKHDNKLHLPEKQPCDKHVPYTVGCCCSLDMYTEALACTQARSNTDAEAELYRPGDRKSCLDFVNTLSFALHTQPQALKQRVMCMLCDDSLASQAV